MAMKSRRLRLVTPSLTAGLDASFHGYCHPVGSFSICHVQIQIYAPADVDESRGRGHLLARPRARRPAPQGPPQADEPDAAKEQESRQGDQREGKPGLGASVPPD